MAIGVGNLVSAADFNAIYNTINKVLGDDGVNAQVGYGRALNSSPVSSGDVIDSTLLDALYADLVRARTHQRGTNFTWDTPADGINAPDTGEYIGAFAADIGSGGTSETATADEAEGFLDFSQAAADILADIADIGGDQTSIQLQHQATRTTAWNGSIIHEVDLVFANANQRRYFFNSGGLIILNANLAGGNSVAGDQTATYPDSPAYQKDEIWQTMLNNMGTIYIGPTATTASGTGTTSSVGNYDLTSNYQTAFTKSGSGVYSENFYRIEAKGAQTSNTISLKITFSDSDTGDNRDADLGFPGQGTAVDENVTGTITSSISTRAATGALGINHPGHAVTSQLGGGGALDSYVLSTSATTISEGSSVTITLQTTNVPDGNVGYTITDQTLAFGGSGGFTSSDLSSGSVSGNFALSNGFASLTFTLANDGVSEGTETMNLALDNGRANISIDIVDGGVATASLVANPTVIDEGQSTTFTLTTTNTPPASYGYTITGIDAADLSSGSLTGNIVTSGTTAQNSGSVSVTLANDVTTEGPEVITFSAAGETATAQVNDTSGAPTPPSVSIGSFDLGDLYVYGLSGTDPDKGSGTIIYFAADGDVHADSRRTDGIYNQVVTTLAPVSNWLPAGTLASEYEIKYETANVSGSPSFVISNNAPTFQQFGSTGGFSIEFYQPSTNGFAFATVDLTITIREIANPSNSTTGTYANIRFDVEQ